MNIGHTYESTARLVHAITGEYPTAEGLHGAYRAAISNPALRPMTVDGGGIAIGYEDGDWANHCTEHGIFEHIFKGAGPTDGPTRAAWEAKVTEALDLIFTIAPGLRLMVDLLVTDLVILNSGADGGGSASQLPGVVVMSPGAEWDVLDYAMCLVHEGTHLNLFVADKVYGTFALSSRELDADQYHALSAVKIGQRRPLDKAFHAAAVTVPLMFMERRQGRTTLVDLYTSSLRDACADLEKQRDHFTPYGRLLLDELCDFGESIDFDEVARSISSPDYAGYLPVSV
ncbi:HEXXH motif-containing putative peptide modification protein [Streptomyces sp. P9(2023)]|uniref:aKG-HExxH-type peptide beta-hydroxylase n=1 Tax=Streptomyces sp. P9(2023) TaxID=3064394 RepID=UPI0028F43050|nr:HEXXH motif-containing putative peptide modification protein [Streptomyces sp. P9(2023)]MDT9692249.1 HEXXH motif-containing putative peptide modification protein [Streptomyces sp. P9(2023)]